MTTKRDVLRGISLVFDPLGFYSPLTIRAKILIQDLWKEKFEWDQPLPVELRDRWDAIAVDLEGVKFVKPRSYFGSSQQIQRLQVFVDASPSAFGAAAYFVNNNQTAFIMAKNQSRTAEDHGQRKADDSSHGADGCPFRSPTCYYNHQRHNHQRHEKG